MLKLVTKGFYNELVKYGVGQPDILTIASHLLDQVIRQEKGPGEPGQYYSRYFTVKSVVDEWSQARRLILERVRMEPLGSALIPLVAGWLADSATRDSFVGAFPDSVADLERYFADPSRFYLIVFYGDDPVVIVGAENIDEAAGRLEMRKLVGRSDLRGKGIGKRATFAFLYHVFMIRGFEKVYVHSTDINIRNLNLNSQFGFELEGIFMQEIPGQRGRQDVVRMGLLRSNWLRIFGAEAS